MSFDPNPRRVYLFCGSLLIRIFAEPAGIREYTYLPSDLHFLGDERKLGLMAGCFIIFLPEKATHESLDVIITKVQQRGGS